MSSKDKEVQRLVTQHDKKREAQIAYVASELESTLRRAARQVSDGIDTEQMTVTEVAARLQRFEELLAEYGISDTYQKGVGIYREELEAVQAQLDVYGYENQLTGADERILDQLIQFDFEKIDNTINQYGASLRQQITRATVLNAPFNIDSVTDSLSKTIKNRIETELRTGAAGLNRSITFVRATDIKDVPKFRYIGPDDKITRVFCREHLDKEYTAEEIGRLDNGQGLDVMAYGGGWNCRHDWVFVG